MNKIDAWFDRRTQREWLMFDAFAIVINVAAAWFSYPAIWFVANVFVAGFMTNATFNAWKFWGRFRRLDEMHKEMDDLIDQVRVSYAHLAMIEKPQQPRVH